jgi:5-methyltetrahydropteroyltriglutamate--homocysteine methyltransferase
MGNDMNVIPQLIGYPRIGPQRELKRVLEAAWTDRLPTFDARVGELRASHLAEQQALVGSAVDDFFLYDEVLETAMMFGLVPDPFRDLEPFQALSALARGTAELEAWEMTKWFDTNYHYVVPEIERSPSAFRPLPWRNPLPAPQGQGPVTWSVLGPYSLMELAKLAEHLEPQELAAELGAAFWGWVAEATERHPGFRLQIDEPYLGLASDLDAAGLLRASYLDAKELRLARPPLVTAQFASPPEDALRFLGDCGLAVQVPLAVAERLAGSPTLESQPELVVSVMDGRSVWPDDFDPAAQAIARLEPGSDVVRIVPSTSLMFLPYTVEGEDLPEGFWFAREKAGALRAWAEALQRGERPETAGPHVADFPEVGQLEQRTSRTERWVAQKDLDLPLHPTTTTGSLPQTAEVRRARARFQREEISPEEYQQAVDEFIREGIVWQEAIGLDVLVHGEFERSDMVEYFAEKMDGFHTTQNGWVLSYGSRCVRPPILAAPPAISEPMTVREWKVAQEATQRPVKGMLTGPVTIVNWSFRPPGVPDDRLFWAVARPIAQEVQYLVEAGARVIQVDEPAVRERWPLPTEDAAQRRETYARGVRAALNHVFNAPPEIQMHTHMCYGTDATIAPLWAEAGVDVASIYFARSKDDDRIRAFYDLFEDGHLQIGPGVFDVHSPHSPGAEVMSERLEHFLAFMEPGDLWVNPDCGLKTRTWAEIEVQVGDLVAAARARRAALGGLGGHGGPEAAGSPLVSCSRRTPQEEEGLGGHGGPEAAGSPPVSSSRRTPQEEEGLGGHGGPEAAGSPPVSSSRRTPQEREGR